MRRRQGLRALSTWLAAGALLVAPPAVAVPAAGIDAGANAGTNAIACAVDYSVNDWGGGFTANLRITNLGDPLTSWTLTFTFPGNQRVTNGWSATWDQPQGSPDVTATNMPWNGNLGTGQSTEVGFNASYTGANNNPTNFAINGVACDGTNQAPTATLTQPAAGSSHAAGSDIQLAATASDPDGSVAMVEFYAGSTLLGTDSTSPYQFTWTNVAAGDYVLVARAYDDQDAFGNSAPVDITVRPSQGPAVLAEPTAVSVPEGDTATFTVQLSQQPAGNVTVTTTRTSGDTDLTVQSGGSVAFSTTNWDTPRTVTLAAAEDGDEVNGTAVFTASAPQHTAATVDATEDDNDRSGDNERFLALYAKIKDPASGYFSSHNPPVPYHSVETLIVEAPDYGHVTTSEAFSYWIWLEAQYGQVTGNWAPFNQAWTSMEQHIIPSAADQPGNSAYNPSSPATYAPEHDNPNQYPSQLDPNVPVGQDPLANELRSTYGTGDIYGMHWLLDVDNRYGYGRCGDGTTSPAYINTFQRGPEESTWETVPHPSCDTFTHGGPNGYVDLFVGDSQYARQWRYTNAPDADARAIQAAYWALQWATDQGNQSQIAATVDKAARMGDYLRYSMFDKYFKRIGNCVGPTQCPGGTGRDSAHYLLSWYFAWGGGSDGGWAWRIGSSPSHFGYQNPMAAYALANVPQLQPDSPTAVSDWQASLQRQLEFYRWLQSAEGGIAGGATNSWAGRYAQPPSGTSTFYGMYYDWQPVYHDPPSNRWFGMQTWSMQRVAEYYSVTGDADAEALLDEWVPWAIANTTVNPANGTWLIPAELGWSGQPDTWNPSNPGGNNGLHVTVTSRNQDLGVTSALARTLMYYAARSGDAAARTLAGNLLDAMWAPNNQDARGISVVESRADYERFDDPVYIPPGWTGTMPNGDQINSNSTFDSIRSWYRSDEDWPQVDAYLNDNGPVPTFRYHRFWAQADIALALAEYERLF